MEYQNDASQGSNVVSNRDSMYRVQGMLCWRTFAFLPVTYGLGLRFGDLSSSSVQVIVNNGSAQHLPSSPESCPSPRRDGYLFLGA